MKTIIPDEMAAKAFMASNGELAWRRDQLPEVVGFYARNGHAVEAFEVWLVEDSGRWDGLIPTIGSDVPSVCVYDVEEKKATENREAFVARCAQEILRKVCEWDIDTNVVADIRARIRYNLYVAEEYAEQPAQT